MLLAGGTHRECAEAAGVQRATVAGWVNPHVPFITEVEQRRQQRSEHLSDLVGEALIQAVTVMIAPPRTGRRYRGVAFLGSALPSVLRIPHGIDLNQSQLELDSVSL